MTDLPATTTDHGQREASVMLAELCGWDVRFGLIDSDQSWDGFAHDTLTITANDGEWCDNLYDPANMALAWRVLNWARSSDSMVTVRHLSDQSPYSVPLKHVICDRIYEDVDLLSLPPAEAQRAWLDKILSLAIEAGMI